MPNTRRMQWPYPAENTDPWFDAFVGLMNALDASGYAAREDRNLVVRGGGKFSFDVSTSLLAWNGTISILSPTVGFSTEIPAGTATLNKGDILYVDVVRNPTKTQTVSAASAATMPASDTAFFLAARIEDTIYFRGGASLTSGALASVFDSNVLVAPGQRLRDQLTMAVGVENSNTAPIAAGGTYLNPADYELDYLTQEYKFVAVASVSSLAITGTVELFNLTDGASVVSINVTDTTVSKLESAPLALPSAEKLYEVRVSASATGADIVSVQWAGFQIDRYR